MDLFFSLILKVGDQSVLVPLTIMGFVFLNRVAWGQAISLYLFTMMFVYVLKLIFKVPLDPAFGIGKYSFPSGLMQSTFVCFGWLFLQTRDHLYKTLFSIILISIAGGMLYFGYVGAIDILGSIGFGLLTLYVFKKLTQKPAYKHHPAKTSVFLWGCFLVLFAGLAIIQGKVAHHLWLPFFVFPGFALSWMYFESAVNHKRLSSGTSVLVFGTVFGFSYLMLLLVSTLIAKGWPLYIANIPWLLVGSSLPFFLRFYGNRQRL